MLLFSHSRGSRIQIYFFKCLKQIKHELKYIKFCGTFIWRYLIPWFIHNLFNCPQQNLAHYKKIINHLRKLWQVSVENQIVMKFNDWFCVKCGDFFQTLRHLFSFNQILEGRRTEENLSLWNISRSSF